MYKLIGNEEDIMQVAQYTYQTPSTSPIQVGKPDTSVQQGSTGSQAENTNVTEKKAESFAATQVKEVTPTVNSNQLFDIYA